MEKTEVKMILPCQCPHCGKDIVVKLDIPSPEITGVIKTEDVDENIKNLINEKNDTPEKTTTT